MSVALQKAKAYLTLSLACLTMLSISLVMSAADLLKSSFSMESSRAVLVTTLSGDLFDILIRDGKRLLSNSCVVSASAQALYAVTYSDGKGSLEASTYSEDF